MNGFPDCGLNADWNCSTYHMGPSKTPNTTSGDYYIVDDRQDDADPLHLVRRHVNEDGYDRTVDIAESHDFNELVCIYLDKISTKPIRIAASAVTAN